MYPISDRFKQALQASHISVTRIDIFVGGKVITLPLIVEGQVTEDYDQSVRRQATVTATDSDGSITPVDAKSLLAPFGNEFQAFSGIEFPDGTTEWVLLGTFGIETCEVIDSGDTLTLQISGMDRSVAVGRAKFRDTYTIGSSTLVTDAIVGILAFIGLDFPTNLSPTDAMASAQIVCNIGDDPWQTFLRLGHACGCDVYFDVDGTLLLKPLRSYAGVTPDWTLEEGDGTLGKGQLTAINRLLKRTDTLANWWIVTGQSADNRSAIPRGEAFDDDPNSPTYVFGPYGVVTNHISDSSIVSDAQATQAAQHYLGENLGRFEEVQTWFLPNPALQVGDLVKVTRALSKLDDNLQLDQVSHPLVATRGSQAITRKRNL